MGFTFSFPGFAEGFDPATIADGLGVSQGAIVEQDDG